MKRKTSLYLVFTLTFILIAFVIATVLLSNRTKTVADSNYEADTEITIDADRFLLSTLPDDFLVIEKEVEEITGGQDNTDESDNKFEVTIPDESIDFDVTSPDEDDKAVELPEEGNDADATLPEIKDDTDITLPDIDDETQSEDVDGSDNNDIDLPDIGNDDEVELPDEDDDTDVELPDEDDNTDVELPDEDDDTDVELPDEDDNKDIDTPDEDDTDVELPDEDDNNDIDTPDEDDNSDTTLPDDDAEGDALPPEDNDDNDVLSPDEEEAEDAIFNVEEIYTTSQANGSGAWLWMLNVNYNGLNASNLLSEKGLYLVFKMTYTEQPTGEENWYAFSYAFYLEENDDHNSTGYLNKYTNTVQFAVVDVAPDDTSYGSYDAETLTEDNFIAVSEVFNNLHFAA